MSIVKIDVNGKGGPCCSWSIDLEIGCRNQCIGCYGTKTSMMGQNYFVNVKEKEYDEKKFRNSCKLASSKGVKFVRFSKHSDSASSHLLENFKSVLKIAGEESIKLIVVSKSLTFDVKVASLMKSYGHILHMSLGMITKAPPDISRLRVATTYKRNGVTTWLRLVGDITAELPLNHCGFIKEQVIVTPMRFAAKETAEIYKADLSKYKWENGYYRPQVIHDDWKKFTHFCGEVNGELKCCKCLNGEKDELLETPVEETEGLS